jgi:hypothetical protein
MGSTAGVQQEGSWTIRTPDGVQQDAWGSVTYRDLCTYVVTPWPGRPRRALALLLASEEEQ